MIFSSARNEKQIFEGELKAFWNEESYPLLFFFFLCVDVFGKINDPNEIAQ